MSLSAEMSPHPDAPDPLGALVPGAVPQIAGNPQPNLPLAGRRFVVKDVIDVAGFVTGAGNPDWARTHAPAAAHAAAVEQLLDAGCTLVGKAQCAELAYSLSGRNVHYGTPQNPAAPTREPGGSSKGPAVAVAGGLCDLGLATHTLGSIRIPASYCGLYGFRPTHGAVSTIGVMPLAQSFDTVGLLARDATLLRTAALILLGGGEGRRPVKLHVATDAFAVLDSPCQQALASTLDRVRGCLPSSDIVVAPAGVRLADCMEAFRALEAAEVWANYGAWITAMQPRFGPDVAEPLAYAAQVPTPRLVAASQVRAQLRSHLGQLLDGTTVLALPAAGGPAPDRHASAEELQAARLGSGQLACLASLAGLPAIVLPAGQVDGAPLGLSLLAAPGADRLLLDLAVRLAAV